MIEKLPFFLLSFAFCLITVFVQKSAGAVSDIGTIGIEDRLINATMSYVRYLGNTVWPVKLAVIYPHPAVYYATAERWAGWQVLLAAIGLLAYFRWCLRCSSGVVLTWPWVGFGTWGPCCR